MIIAADRTVLKYSLKRVGDPDAENVTFKHHPRKAALYAMSKFR